MGRRYDIDWQAVERDYRLGQFTDRELAKQHGVSPSSIGRKAEKLGWTRDLSHEVRARTNAALLSNETQSDTENSVDAAVQNNVAVVREHRADLKRLRTIAQKLGKRLEAVALDPETLEETIRTADDLNDKEKRALLKAIDLGGLVQTASALANVYKSLIPLERQAFNLDAPEAPGEDTPLSQLRKQLSGTAFRPAE